MENKSFGQKVWNRMKTVTTEIIVFKLGVVGHIPSHCVRRFIYRIYGVKIGKGSALHMGIRFYNPRNVRIGQDSIIGEGTVLDGRNSLVIGNHVDIATQVMIYNSQHDVNDENFKAISAPVEISDYVFIGPRAIILPGVKIGKGAVIGAGAVVTKDVEDFKIVGGVPAKEIGERANKDLHYKLGRAAWFR